MFARGGGTDGEVGKTGVRWVQRELGGSALSVEEGRGVSAHVRFQKALDVVRVRVELVIKCVEQFELRVCELRKLCLPNKSVLRRRLRLKDRDGTPQDYGGGGGANAFEGGNRIECMVTSRIEKVLVEATVVDLDLEPPDAVHGPLVHCERWVSVGLDAPAHPVVKFDEKLKSCQFLGGSHSGRLTDGVHPRTPEIILAERGASQP